MPKYTVRVLVTKIERYEVEEDNAELAADNYTSGKLEYVSDEECELQSIDEVKP